MRAGRKLLLAGALAVSCASPAVVQAAAPVFTTPIAIGGGAWDPEAHRGFGLPQALLARDGRATVAWPGRGHLAPDPASGGEGVFVSELPPGGGTFSRPAKVSSDNATSVFLASNDAGMRVLAWSGDGPPEQATSIAIAPPGGGFGQGEHVPIPPRAPAADPSREDSRSVSLSSLAVAPNGTVLVAYDDRDFRADNERGVVATRRPDGTWAEPQVVEDHLQNRGPSVAADGAGGLHVLWAAPPHDGSTQTRRLLYQSDAAPDGRFGAERVLSEPDRDADNGTSDPKLIANRRGDLLVVWESQALGPAIEARLRPAGADWLPIDVIYGGAPFGERPTGALDDRGDALVAWTDGNAHARFRPVGGAWQPHRSTFARQGGIDQIPAALAADGTGVLVSAVTRSAGTTDTIAGFVLPRGRTLEPAVTISPGTEPVSRPQVATDPFGNGLVVWLRGRQSQPSTVFAAGYSSTPPAITAFEARTAAFSLRVTEPARVTITVKGRQRRATQRARVRRGANQLAFGKKVRSLVKHHGRYTATIRARDVGPRTSRPRTITFKR